MKINKQGVWGEIFAARYMRDRGYAMFAVNYRTRVGEIDLIGRKDGIVSFVEVKTRSENAISEPKEAVDISKQEKIIATSKIFMKTYQFPEQPRFDVCEVFLNADMQPVKINYIENAFNA